MRRTAAALAMCVAGLCLVACGSTSPPAGPSAVVVATRDRSGAAEAQLASALRALGFQVRMQAWRTAVLGSPDPVVFPADVAHQVGSVGAKSMRSAVERGGRVVVDGGDSELARSLGIRFAGGKVSVAGGRGSRRYELDATWTSPVDMARFTADAEGVFLAPGGTVVAAAGRLGKGRFVFFGVDLVSPDGQIRVPGLAETLRAGLAMEPAPVERDAVETYFDPAYRHGVDAAELARMWAGRGIRAVHVGGWYGGGGYDYAGFVRELHRAGLRAYMWIEPPMVTGALWDANPACRERTATGAASKQDWRSPLALEDPSCMAIALREYGALLDAAPWDGLNIAELYFETPGLGAGLPTRYTPMHPWVRADFKAKHGFDPADLFDSRSPRFKDRDANALATFTKYRSELVTRLHHDLVQGLRPHLAGRDVVVTVIDDSIDPYVAHNVGQDGAALAAAGRDVGFRVFAEDPFNVWASAPERYRKLRTAWDARRVPYLVDVNVVDRDASNPTRRAGGAELARVIADAAPDGAVAVYSESSVLADDWPVVVAALASRASVSRRGGDLVVRSPYSVRVRVPSSWRSVRVDGTPWRLFSGGRALVSSGTHSLSDGGKAPPGWGLVRTSCELTSASDGGSRMRYGSPSPCYLVIRGKAKVTVDGRLPVVADGPTFRLPSGSHEIRIS